MKVNIEACPEELQKKGKFLVQRSGKRRQLAGPEVNPRGAAIPGHGQQ